MSLHESLSHHSFIASIHHLRSIDSTNTYALNGHALGELSAGALVVADYQTAGKGRFQNRWESSPGDDILMSFILQPSAACQHWGRVSFPLGVALHQALETYLPFDSNVALKWPNDILINGKKCGGMRHDTNASLGVIILGIGINVNQVPDDVHRTSLRCESGQTFDRWSVLNDILGAIGDHLDCISSCRVDADEWNCRSAYIGQHIQVHDNGRVQGKFLGINGDGAALIQTNDRIEIVVAGSNFRLVS